MNGNRTHTFIFQDRILHKTFHVTMFKYIFLVLSSLFVFDSKICVSVSLVYRYMSSLNINACIKNLYSIYYTCEAYVNVKVFGKRETMLFYFFFLFKNKVEKKKQKKWDYSVIHFKCQEMGR